MLPESMVERSAPVAATAASDARKLVVEALRWSTSAKLDPSTTGVRARKLFPDPP
jgi:hypothetical protein